MLKITTLVGLWAAKEVIIDLEQLFPPSFRLDWIKELRWSDLLGFQEGDELPCEIIFLALLADERWARFFPQEQPL